MDLKINLLEIELWNISARSPVNVTKNKDNRNCIINDNKFIVEPQ